MPSRTPSGTASRTSLKACLAADIRDCPSMSRARIEPLTSRTSSTLGDSCCDSSAAATAGNRPVASVARRAHRPAASRLLVIIWRTLLTMGRRSQLGPYDTSAAALADQHAPGLGQRADQQQSASALLIRPGEPWLR